MDENEPYIADELKHYFSEHGYTNELSLSDLKAEYLYSDKSYLSVCYSGFMENETAAYPINFKWGITIDLNSHKKALLSDFVTVDEDLRHYINAKLAQKFHDNSQSIGPYSDMNSFSFYQANGRLMILIDVIHNIGDFAEIEVPVQEFSS